MLIRSSSAVPSDLHLSFDNTMDTRFCRAQLVEGRQCPPAQAAASIRGLLLQGSVDANVAGNLVAAAEALERQHDKGAANAQQDSQLIVDKPATAGEALLLGKKLKPTSMHCY